MQKVHIACIVHILPYLGILFDRTLSWAAHKPKTITKARKLLLAMKPVVANGIGQRIDYGFGLMTLTDTHLKRFHSIQSEAMRIILVRFLRLHRACVWR